MSETLEIPGRGSKKSALGSLLEFRDYFGQIATWVEKRKAEAGAPVFFAHPGMPTVVVSDVVAAAYIFDAPKDVTDRLGNMGFGPLKLFPKVVGPIQPALVARGEANARPVRFLDAALKDALGRFDEVLTTSIDEITAVWVSRGRVSLQEISGVGGKVTARWLVGADLDAIEVAQYPGVAIGISSSSRLLNWVLSIVAGPKSAGVKMVDRLVETIRTAPGFDHVRRIGLETGQSEEELLYQLSFMTLFNTGGLSLTIASTLAQLALSPDWATTIRDELGDSKLTLQGMKDFSALHNVFIESNRMFSRPRAFFREAMSDFDLPCGDGNSYRVRKGDTLLLSMRSVNYDQRQFADADSFKPERFDDNPDLARFVYIFGPHNTPYRCLSRDLGFGTDFFKYILGRLLQGYEWEMSPSPTISRNTRYDYAPADVALVNFRPRA